MNDAFTRPMTFGLRSFVFTPSRRAMSLPLFLLILSPIRVPSTTERSTSRLTSQWLAHSSIDYTNVTLDREACRMQYSSASSLLMSTISSSVVHAGFEML